MSCSGSHLGITINIKNTKFVKDLPMIDAQFSTEALTIGRMIPPGTTSRGIDPVIVI
jgi:hypothetical protein